MKPSNLKIKDLFTDDAKLTFLVGAGCSVDAPSCLPAGRDMMEAIIKYSCAESEIEKILKLKELRFEALVEIIRDRLDPELKLIDYYGICDTPNLQHFFLAEMMKKGHFVMTTNFDFLIEYALEQSGVPKNEIVPVITKQDFETYSTPNELVNEGKKLIYKIHGSTKNIITKENTRDSLIATIKAFGSGKEGENVFQVEPFKRPLFENISSNRTLVVIGYSGSDDFDIVPTLMVLKKLKNIIWINYIQDDGGREKIYEINEAALGKPEQSDKVNQILADIYRMHNAEHVYRVDANTTRLLGKIIDSTPKLHSINFSISPITWLKNNVAPPDDFDKYYIPNQIYDDFDMIEDALNCSKINLNIAEKEGNRTWKAISLNNIGWLLQKKGQLDDALKYYNGSLAIDEQLGNIQGKATTLNNIGMLLEDKGQLEDALKYYNEALAIAEQLGNIQDKAIILNSIGKLLQGKGQLEDALKYYNEALAIAEQLGDLWGKAAILNNIGSLLKGRGELDEALRYYKEALAIDEQLGDLRGKAIDLSNIGSLLKGKGELDEALRYYKEALAIEEQLGDLRGKATDLNNIGSLLYGKGELDEALRYYKEALAISKELESPNAEIIKRNITFLKNNMK